jgi:hypothetical protein
MPQFERYIGIDYSGAQTPTSSLPGLRVYAADGTSPLKEVLPSQSVRKYWTRKGIAEWLRDELSGSKSVLVGIDHAFSFPLRYFEAHHLSLDWLAFLDDFQHHWPTDEDKTPVCFVTDGSRGNGRKRMGDPSWFRLTDLWTPAAKSVFQFNVQGQVATSTHAGLPWLRYLRAQCAGKVHSRPFEGWGIPAGRSVVAEIYPSLWMRCFPREGRNGDQHAAYAVAAWLQRADLNGWLPRYFEPPLTPEERAIAKVEGWILGVM